MYIKILLIPLILLSSLIVSCGSKTTATYPQKSALHLIRMMKKTKTNVLFVYRDDGIRGVSRPINCYLDEKFIGVLDDGTYVLAPIKPGRHMLYCGVNVATHGSSYSNIKIFTVGRKRDVFIKVSQGGLVIPSLTIKEVRRLPEDFFEDFKLSKGCVFCLKYK